ncbi:MAG: LysR substrate-binding domain-containing protein [Pseudomonadota bacterium]
MRRLTLDSLEVLDAIDRKGSFAAAAAELYRVPSKVTYSVKKLETDLGVRLFRREGRRSVLTPAGRALLDGGRELLAATDRVIETTRQVHNGWETGLRIAIDAVLDLASIQPALEALYDARPEIEVDLSTEVLGGSWEAVETGRADLVVGAPDNVPVPIGVACVPIGTLPWVYAVAPQHRMAGRSQVSRAALARERAVVVRDSSRTLPPQSLRVFDTQPTLRVATMEQKIEALSAGLGGGFVPQHAITAHLASGELVEVDLSEPEPVAKIFAGWKRGALGRAGTLVRDALAS